MTAIRTADAMVGFTIRREAVAEGQYRTHDWVVQELMAAHAGDPRVPWVEIREEGVISPGGILESVMRKGSSVDEEGLATCLIKIAQAVKRFKDLTDVTTIRLGPAWAVEQISAFLDDATFVCTWQGLRDSVRQSPRLVPAFPIRGGVFVQLRGVAQGELVRITISARGRTWRSDYESADTLDVQVKE